MHSIYINFNYNVIQCCHNIDIEFYKHILFILIVNNLLGITDVNLNIRITQKFDMKIYFNQ